MFTYCTASIVEGGLGYSEGAAYRRIQAARSFRNNPGVYELLRDGKLSLCTLTEASKVITSDNKEEIIEAIQGKSKAEVQKITAIHKAPVAPLQKEQVRVKKVIIENKEPLFSIQQDNTEITSNTAKETTETRFSFT